jgi:cation:H+ antiporter
MVFQSCIPTAIGVALAASAWTISQETLLSFASAGIAFASTAVIFIPMARRGTLSGANLLIGGLFYLVYIGIVVTHLAGMW